MLTLRTELAERNQEAKDKEQKLAEDMAVLRGVCVCVFERERGRERESMHTHTHTHTRNTYVCIRIYIHTHTHTHTQGGKDKRHGERWNLKMNCRPRLPARQKCRSLLAMYLVY
jgi:hypothetical protein